MFNFFRPWARAQLGTMILKKIFITFYYSACTKYVFPLPRCGGTVVSSQHMLPAYKNLYFTLTKVWWKHCGLTAYTNLYFPLTKVWWNRCGLTACALSIYKYIFLPYQVVAEPLLAHSICPSMYKSVFPAYQCVAELL